MLHLVDLGPDGVALGVDDVDPVTAERGEDHLAPGPRIVAVAAGAGVPSRVV